ncbi:MAG: ASCH domain-containing protein [Aliihoeflea sp.]
MQELNVVPRLFPAILSGEKRSTIRWRERRIVPGPMRYVCEGDASRSVVVRVVRCTDMPLSDVAAYLGREADWPEAVMLTGMREHYPDIGWLDTVQLIEHLPPQTSRG